MRDGEYVGTVDTKDTTKDEIDKLVEVIRDDILPRVRR
jgi:hypothetical protein